MSNRTPLVLTASIAALLAAAAPASANVGARCTDQVITIDLTAWWAGPVSLDDLTVEVAGQVVRRGPYAFTGPAGSLAVVAPTPGPVVATARRGADLWTSPVATCAPLELTPPAPAPTTGPTTGGAPVGEVPAVVTTPGRRSMPPVKHRARPRYLCPAPLPSKAWQRIILRRHGVRCPLRRPAPPVHVAVAGERVPAAVSLARWVAQAIPAATGDRPSNWPPSIEGGATTAHLVAAFVRSGPPARPAAVAGMAAWRCTGTRSMTCTSSRTTLQLGVVVRYFATHRRSMLVVDVGPRIGGAR